jgi:hypothetical protein
LFSIPFQIFSKSPDPDFEGAHLLEQHQAPITAALTPAFSSDSTPEILSSAIRVCAIFVGCGVIKDVSKMGRILKLLTGALERCKGMFTILIYFYGIYLSILLTECMTLD